MKEKSCKNTLHFKDNGSECNRVNSVSRAIDDIVKLLHPSIPTHPLEWAEIIQSGGSISSCGTCSWERCCGIASRDGELELPFLTEIDIELIEAKTHLARMEFVDLRHEPQTGKTLAFLKGNEKGGCLFFDGKCTVFDFRPIDCRLFPLDVIEENGRLFWILYNYQHCSCSEEDVQSLLDYGRRVLPILAPYLEEYATMRLRKMDQLPRKNLAEIDREYVRNTEKT